MIKQVEVSDSVIYFKPYIEKRFDLHSYHDPNKPALFFGCYTQKDIDAILRHKAKCLIVWCGSDTLKMETGDKRLHKENIKHIAISQDIKNTLYSKGIITEHIPISSVIPIINVKPKGDKIYFYAGRKRARNFYGGEMVDEIKSKINYEILEVYHGDYNHYELQKIYKECFVGLRLPKHDGLSNTVVELGLMGRRCIQNSWIPTSLSYNSIDSIINNIKIEYKNKDNIEDANSIAINMYNYINIEKNWLNI